MRSVAIVILALGLTACASTARLSGYRGSGIVSDATVIVQGKPMTITVHPREDYLLGQVTIGSAAASGFVEGLTFGLAKGHRLDPRDVDAALAAFVAPAGCTMDPVRQVGNEQVSFEGRYRCPEGVDLRALILEQRAALRDGHPLHR